MVGGPETILLYIFIIVLAAKLGGQFARWIGQPTVLGEIIAGFIIGPSLLRLIPSFSILDSTRSTIDHVAAGNAGPLPPSFLFDLPDALGLEVVRVFALLGVTLLLFEVGLESNIAHMRRVGPSALLVGSYGVLFSLAAGYGISWLLDQRLPWATTATAAANPHLLHLFIGAMLTATSVGITARVLGDMQRLRTDEGQIILGAAVWDDILGLVVLAVISGLVLDPTAVDAFAIGRVLISAIGFFAAALLVGRLLGPRLLDLFVERLRADSHIGFGFGFLLMLLLAYLSTVVGLAAIVGAFAAGLVLSGSTHHLDLSQRVQSIGSIFSGFFFVVLGMHIDVRGIGADVWKPILLAIAALTIIGIIAKLASGLGVLRSKADRLLVGVGMVPRGEVGLIFALFGLEHGLVENWQYTAIVLVVLLTTVVTPPWLKALRSRFSPSAAPPPPQAALAPALEP